MLYNQYIHRLDFQNDPALLFNVDLQPKCGYWGLSQPHWLMWESHCMRRLREEKASLGYITRPYWGSGVGGLTESRELNWQGLSIDSHNLADIECL